MPQLMPLFWLFYVFILFLLLIVTVYLYDNLLVLIIYDDDLKVDNNKNFYKW